MKRKSKLGRIVRYCFSLLLTIAITRDVVCYWAYKNFVKAHELCIHTYMTVMSLRDLQDLLLDAAYGSRAYVITGDEKGYAPFTKAKSAFEDKLSEIRSLLEPDEPEQVEAFDELVGLARKTIEYQGNIITTMKEGKHDEAAALIEAGTGVQLMDASRRKAAEIINPKLQDLGPQYQIASRAQFYTTLTNIGGTLFAIGVFLFLLFSTFRKMVLPIRNVTSTIASVSTQIAATVEQPESTAFPPSSPNATTATIEELEHSFHQMDEAADAAGARANQAIALAEGGSTTVNQSLAGITDLKEKVGAIAEQTLRLSEQTSQIGAVINLVSDLADQTNMLALNAAVEAARAGEHGKGFAVVATEIRKLADQSRKSAEKVNTLVADIRKATDATVMVTAEGTKTAAQGMALAQSTAEAFNSLKSSLGTIVENFQQTRMSISQQLTAVKQVAQAMKTDSDQLKDAVQKLEEIV